MKNIIKYIFVIFGSTVLWSCEDQIEVTFKIQILW